MATAQVATTGQLGLKVGDLVEVRSAEEILATLDENGELAGLPFMPEMLAYCGRRLTVHKVAQSSATTSRRRAAAHVPRGAPRPSRAATGRDGGCQNACSLYWKEQWLKRGRSGRPRPAEADAGRRTLLPLLVEEDHEGAVRGR